MKLNELMDGDWVFDKETKQPRRISVINVLLFHDNYDPIPLTEEILVKNRFVVESCGCVWYQEQGIQEQNYLIVGFRRNGEPRRIEVFFVNKIKAEIRDIYYVYQLQHLLWLCGIDKEIEL